MIRQKRRLQVASPAGKNKERFWWICGGNSRQIFPSRMKTSSIGAHFGILALAVLADGVVAPGAKLQKLAGDFAFTEGPTCDKNGNVFFVDQPNNRIMEWSADGKLSTFMQPSGYANGMHFRREGQSHRLRGRTQPALVHRARQNRDRAGHQLSGQIHERPERRVGRAQRRDVHHRPVLQAHWWDHTRWR
jgi:hypothetical protein